MRINVSKEEVLQIFINPVPPRILCLSVYPNRQFQLGGASKMCSLVPDQTAVIFFIGVYKHSRPFSKEMARNKERRTFIVQCLVQSHFLQRIVRVRQILSLIVRCAIILLVLLVLVVYVYLFHFHLFIAWPMADLHKNSVLIYVIFVQEIDIVRRRPHFVSVQLLNADILL